MHEVGFNREYAKLELQHRLLKEQVANQLELYTHLTEVVGPGLKSAYMMKIGQFEHRVFELKTEINRWKRRFTLRQQALNRGEQPNLVAIEAALDGEFAAYLTEVRKHLEELKAAAGVFHAARVSEQEATEIRVAYLNAVKRLHPDLNPQLPPAAADLWNQIQQAYGAKDWGQFRFLAGLVDGVASGESDFQSTADGLAALKAACDELLRRSREIAARTEQLKSAPPFTYEELLSDAGLVQERRQQLSAQIAALEKCIVEYEELWKNGK